jgi:hypothetical protein
MADLRGLLAPDVPLAFGFAFCFLIDAIICRSTRRF